MAAEPPGSAMRPTSMTRRRLLGTSCGRAALLVVAVAALAACGQAATPGATPAVASTATAEPVPGLTEADAVSYALWQLAGPADYRFTVDVQCFCPAAQPVEVTVRDGAVISVKPSPPEFWSEVVVPVPDLFRLVGELRGTADVVDVTYDAEAGYPTTIAVDRITEAVDDEVSYVVTAFTPLR